jgi:hypothetical protein
MVDQSEVRERAYRAWVAAGRPKGEEEMYLARAVAELRQDEEFTAIAETSGDEVAAAEDTASPGPPRDIFWR